MENIKEIVAKNIVSLRKAKNLTQIDLAKKIHFSDKAISRWENAEVSPDLETLEKLSKVLGVSLAYMLEPHEEIKPVETKRKIDNDLLINILACGVVWVILTILFVYLKLFYNYIFWQGFVWGIPISTSFMALYFRRKENKLAKMILRTILNWTIIASVYLQLLAYNLWLIFIIGIPVQACIIIGYFSVSRKKTF